MLTHRSATILGDVPGDWHKSLLKNLLSDYVSGDWGGEDGECQVRVLRSTNFNSRGTLDLTDVAVRYFSLKKAGSFGLSKNDILLERSGGGPAQPVGRVGSVQNELKGFWISNFVQLLRPDAASIAPEFLAWLLFRVHQSGVVERLQHQTTQMRNLDFREYLRVYLPVPPTQTEQRTIANLLQLCRECLQLSEQKVQLARRLKTALSQQLFKRGIPGRHTQFTDTDLGKIPSTWNIRRIKDITKGEIYNGVSPQSHPAPPGTPIVNVSCISDGRCNLEKITYVDLDGTPDEDVLATKGDFYILRGNGNRDFIGTGGLLTDEPPAGCLFSDLLIKIPIDAEQTALGFVPFMWQSSDFLRRLQSKAVSGSGLWKIGLREIRRHEFACPPKPEQEEIVEVLNASEAAIEASEQEVKAVEQLMSALLQTLLTGRVRTKV